MRALLASIGEHPDREGLRMTPARVWRALHEMTRGYEQDPEEILSTVFKADPIPDELIVVEGVQFSSLCEHHLLPFTGHATIGYLPDRRIVGLSKLARLVDCFARRLQMQERMTEQLADAVQDHLRARGTAVVVVAAHACMGCRGALKPGATMRTSALRGALRERAALRAEFFALATR